MPQIGEIRKGREIGFPKRISCKFIWQPCLDCGKERWIGIRKGQPESLRCHSCANKLHHCRKGKESHRWKGGKYKNHHGYIYIQLQPEDFFYSMTNTRGRVFEHRLVVAKALGRCLHSWEIVHHKKGFAKDDNRYPETLQLVTDERHTQITILENKIKRLEEKVKLLEWHIRELRGGLVKEIKEVI